MDFILAHIFSIIFFSKNGITLKHKFLPLIALYTKGLPIQKNDCSWKKYGNHQTPCLITTAYSIQLLAKTANFILNSPEVFKEPSFASVIGHELVNLSILQLDYCLENLKNEHYSIELYTSLLEACLAVSELKSNHTFSDVNRLLNYNDVIDTLYNKLSLSSSLDSADTLELSRIVNAIHQLSCKIPSYPAEDMIAKTALELAHRRNSLGLFQRDKIHRKTAPLGWQFHCIASLLSSYSIYPIDKVLEEAFSAFNHLYKLSWNPSLGMFSFRRNPYIRYTAFEITTTIKALYILSSWVSGEEQLHQLDQILSNYYLPIISEKFLSNYQQSIYALYSHLAEKMQLPYHDSNFEGYNVKLHRAPVFPTAIEIGYLNHSKKTQIYWINRSPLQLRYPLQLCICLLDSLMLQNSKQEQPDNEDSPLSWLDSLFSIISQLG